MKKLYLLNTLIFLIIVAILTQNVKAQVSVWDGYAESWTQGDGTENNPYLIENARQLAYIAEMVNAGVTHYDSTYFKLTTDIRIDSITQWQPIGLNSIYYFSGFFDGQNHTITIFLYNSTLEYAGIFGYVKNAQIKNVMSAGCINNRTTTGGSIGGGLIGVGQNIVIENCKNSSDIVATTRAGGIVGEAYHATICNCSNKGEITSYHNYYSTASGGIVGSVLESGTTLFLCFNTGQVFSKSYSGGIIGRLMSFTSIINCYNIGMISTPLNIEEACAAGICVSLVSSTTEIICKNCYNVGQLQSVYMGGIIVSYSTSYFCTSENCYYLNTCGQNTSTGGTAKTEAQMKSSSFPVILNSDSIVYVMDTLNINQGYPIFANEIYVLTQDAENVGFSSATLKGIYSGSADIKGFKYKQESDSNFTTVYCSLNSPYSYNLTELPTGTTFQYVYFVQKNGLTYYGDIKAFTTTVCDISVIIDKQTDAICMGDSVSLVAQAQSAYSTQFSFIWSTGESGNHISPTQNGVYSVTASDENGCYQTQNYSLSLYPSPEGSISGDTVLCAGSSVALTAFGAWSYQWDNGHHGATINVAAPGTYSCTFTNEYGCTSEKSITITSFSDFSIAGNPHVCNGAGTVLYAPVADSCLWNNGAQSFSIMVTEPGMYGVTIYHGACEASAEIFVTAASLPTPIITGNTSICEGQSTTLTATGGNNYSWNNGSTQNSIVVTQSGNYTVTVTNTDGCSASTSTTVTVNPLPNVTISGSSSFCQGGSTTLTASGANTYLWSNASTNAAITINNAGIYTVTGTDINGCTNTASQTVAVNPTYNIPLTHSICEGESYNFYGQNLTSAGTYTNTLQTINGCDSVLILTLTVKTLPTASITGNTTICEGQSTTLTATGGNSYSWSTGSTNSSISVNQSGLYTVTATNTDGCSASTSTTVTVNPLPTITISGNTTVCQGSSTTLTASGADSYSWTTGENTASVSISSFGVYTVTGTSAEGCSSTADVTVLVSQLPVITISGEADFCAGGSTTLTANGGTSYLWSDGTTDASITVNTAGTYQVIGYNTAGCNSMESVTVNQWQPASSEFTITTNENCYEWNGQSYCQTGDYTQTFQTIHGCDSVVILHLTIETGIDNYAMNASMNIYPNPTSDVVNVQLTTNNEQFGNVAIQVYDVFGKMLDMVNVGNSDAMNRIPTGHSMDSYGGVTNVHGLSAQTTQIDLSRYANGVYFIKAMSEGNVLAVKKVVKN